jgi:hypothetical protein
MHTCFVQTRVNLLPQASFLCDENIQTPSFLFCWFLKFFLLGYIRCAVGIHCDNSKWAYIVHWLDHSHHSPAQPPPHPT